MKPTRLDWTSIWHFAPCEHENRRVVLARPSLGLWWAVTTTGPRKDLVRYSAPSKGEAVARAMAHLPCSCIRVSPAK